jgi:hypothetical protein
LNFAFQSCPAGEELVGGTVLFPLQPNPSLATMQKKMLHEGTIAGEGAMLVFEQTFGHEYTIGPHACWFEASLRAAYLSSGNDL